MSVSQFVVTPEILAAYGFDTSLTAEPFPGGHINSTFLLDDGIRKRLLQRINRYVFKRPDHIMENMEGVTAYLKQKVKERGGNPKVEALAIKKTLDGKSHFIDRDGEYWRCLAFIDCTVCYEQVTGLDMLEAAGYAFGDFQSLLRDYPAESLHEIIPNFHHTPERLRQLKDAAMEDKAGRLSSVSAEMDFALKREDDCGILMDLLERGELPLKVTHNDTKMSNILFDRDSNQPVCIIDLDTVMPGLTAFDFGDSIRAGATTAPEDEKNLDKVKFSFPHYQAYTRGFMRAAASSLTEAEVRSLAIGAKLITLEVGMRFLADYLNGDVYFQTKYPDHNLDRARNQFKLVSEIEKVLPQMQDEAMRLFQEMRNG